MIKIFGTENCQYCSDARTLCAQKELSYIYTPIDLYMDKYEELVEKIGNFKTVPQILVDGHHIGGYEELRDYVYG